MVYRMLRDPARKEKVFAELRKFEETGVAIEIDNVNDDATATNPRWNTPRHVVIKRGKTRVCHDARMATGGYCLNDLHCRMPHCFHATWAEN